MWKANIDSPFGTLQSFVTDAGICGLLWPNDRSERFGPNVPQIDIDSHPQLRLLQQQLHQYFAGERQDFDLPLDMRGTPFQVEAWYGLQQIPYGQTRTYSQQAIQIGRPTAVRAVAAANSKNPISIVVPCHRVIGKNGQLTGFAGGIDVKQRLLKLETDTLLKNKRNI